MLLTALFLLIRRQWKTAPTLEQVSLFLEGALESLGLDHPRHLLVLSIEHDVLKHFEDDAAEAPEIVGEVVRFLDQADLRRAVPSAADVQRHRSLHRPASLAVILELSLDV